MVSDNDIINAFKVAVSKYGKAHAARIEQLFRNETRHFKSGNFLTTLSPGMQATAPLLPYGWRSLDIFWTLNPQYAPTGIHIQTENTSALAKSIGAQKFMIFPTIEGAVMSVCELIKLRGGNAGTWFSNDPELQKRYNEELDKIIPRFTNQIK